MKYKVSKIIYTMKKIQIACTIRFLDFLALFPLSGSFNVIPCGKLYAKFPEKEISGDKLERL